MAATEDLNRLTTFQHHVEDMRNLVMCKICLKPLYEPYILACGHTYCYGCLRSWFCGQPSENRRRKKNCPDCRADVKLTPSPNYILRDLVHMFISRAELLPEDETVDEHVAGKLLEAGLLASDKERDGLFQGIFRSIHDRLTSFGPLQDVADGVLRCPECHWELQDGRCEECGYEIDSDDYLDFSDEGSSIMDNDDGDSIRSEESSIGSNSSVSRRGLRHHFHGGRPLDNDLGLDLPEEIYGRHYDDLPFGTMSEDDEIEGFINDHEEDEPDEVDEDDMGPATAMYGYPPVPRRTHYRIPDSEDDDEGDSQEEDHDVEIDEDDEDQDGLEEAILNHLDQHHRRTGITDGTESEGSLEDIDQSNQDQLTNYDESDEAEDIDIAPAVRRSFIGRRPIVQRTFRHRRRPIVISDDDDYEDDEEISNLQRYSTDVETDTENHEEEINHVRQNSADVETETEGYSQTEGAVKDESDDSDSDATATTPQPSRSRRQRLEVHRKRRHVPNQWRALVRGGNQDTSNSRRDRLGSRHSNVEVLVGPSRSS